MKEGIGSLQLMILNKKLIAGKVRIRTVEGGASEKKDFGPVDTVIHFA